jgi:4-amino-4-deoxy-L-arabinose transferase-like glycosyltransferase
VLNVVSGYVLPVLMGLLGSMAYVLRRYLRSVGDRLLTPRDLREYIVRLVLGTVFGVAIGFFTTAENVIANPVSSLGAPALAFLAGYGVEAVFRMLDGLADQFSPRESDVVSTKEAVARPREVAWLTGSGGRI